MFDFAIRDADTNHHTDPAELERVYGKYDLPISLAVVPNHGCTRSPAIPETYWYDTDSERRFPLAENESLVEYLQDGIAAGRYSILQHGYDHRRTPAGPEFARHGDLHKRLLEGREHLESTLDIDIEVFVPPDGVLSREGLRALAAARMPVLYYRTPRGRPRTAEIPRMLGADALFKYHHRQVNLITFIQELYRLWAIGDRSVSLPSQATRYRIGGNWEFTPTSLIESAGTTRVKRQLSLADELDGKFCLAVHYHNFRSDGFRKQFEEVVRYARNELTPNFVHCDTLFN
jgi:hypothetical protein